MGSVRHGMVWNNGIAFAAGRTLSRVLSLTKDRPKVVSKPVLSKVEGGRSSGETSGNRLAGMSCASVSTLSDTGRCRRRAPHGVRTPVFAHLRSCAGDGAIAPHSRRGNPVGWGEHSLKGIDRAQPAELLALLGGLYQRFQIALHGLQFGAVSRPVTLLEVLLRPLVMLQS
jgi:hypothetical protein